MLKACHVVYILQKQSSAVIFVSKLINPLVHALGILICPIKGCNDHEQV